MTEFLTVPKVVSFFSSAEILCKIHKDGKSIIA